MSQRLALWALGLCSPLLLLGFVWPLPGGPTLFALAVTLFPVALMALGASRDGSSGPVGRSLLLLLAVFGAVMTGLFVFRGRVEEGPWFGGLPAAAAFLVYGLFLVPLLVSSLAHAFTFEGWTLPEERLEALRRRFPSAGSEGAVGSGSNPGGDCDGGSDGGSDTSEPGGATP